MADTCTEPFFMMYVLCIVRSILTVGAIVCCVVVFSNFKAIEDAINCIKLASEVLFQNFILVVQPLYNTIFKLLFFGVFSIIIVQAMSTAGFTADVIVFAVPAQDGGVPYDITIGGMSRKLDILNNPAAVGNDIYYIWLEIFTMYWWVALVLAVEQFSTIMTIMLWFFLQKDGQWIPDKTPSSLFCHALGMTFKYNLGTILTGSFMVAVVNTAITACYVYKSAIEALLGHEKLQKIKE